MTPQTPQTRDEPVDKQAPHSDAAHDSAALERARLWSAILGVSLLAVAVALFVVIYADPIGSVVQPFDDWWLSTVESNRYPLLVDTAKVLDKVGSPWVTFPIRVVAVVVLVARRRWIQLSAFLTAIVLSELAIGPLKALVDRPRPPSIVVTSGASFPSGHAIATAVTAFGIVAAFLPRGRRRLGWTIAATLIAGSMAWSRTYLGAHWATDTIAGMCIGAGVAILSEVAFEEGRRRAALRAAS